MNSVSFWTGVGLHPFDPYTFSRPIAMLSTTTNVPRLNMQELFAYLTNLGDEFCTGTISRAKRSPYQNQITVFCRKCSDKVTKFVVYTDEDTFAFSLMIKQICPNQKWTMIESANGRGRTMVSRPLPKEKNEWANEHPRRVICKRPLRLPLFPYDLRGYYTEHVFSKRHQ
jgi:hypothetical protein